MFYQQTYQASTSIMSRDTRQADSFCEATSGDAAFKHDPTRDPTILLYLFISLNLNNNSSQYSKWRLTSSKLTDPISGCQIRTKREIIPNSTSIEQREPWKTT